MNIRIVTIEQPKVRPCSCGAQICNSIRTHRSWWAQWPLTRLIWRWIQHESALLPILIGTLQVKSAITLNYKECHKLPKLVTVCIMAIYLSKLYKRHPHVTLNSRSHWTGIKLKSTSIKYSPKWGDVPSWHLTPQPAASRVERERHHHSRLRANSSTNRREQESKLCATDRIKQPWRCLRSTN